MQIFMDDAVNIEMRFILQDHNVRVDTENLILVYPAVILPGLRKI
jgi:hypothetical protein